MSQIYFVETSEQRRRNPRVSDVSKEQRPAVASERVHVVDVRRAWKGVLTHDRPACDVNDGDSCPSGFILLAEARDDHRRAAPHALDRATQERQRHAPRLSAREPIPQRRRVLLDER